MDAPANQPSPIETDHSADLSIPLIVCYVGLPTKEPLCALLERCPPVSRVVVLRHAVETLKEIPQARMILLFDAPERQVAQAMQCEIPPSTGLDNWCASARDILAVLRTQRRRITLVESHTAQIYADFFAARFGLGTEAAQDIAALNPPKIDPVLLSIADACVLRNAGALALSAELAASTLDLSNGDPAGEPYADQAYSHYVRAQEELDEVRSDMEKQFLEHREVAALEEELSASHSKLSALLEEQCTLMAQLHGMQSDMERQYEERRRLSRELDASRAANKTLTVKADQLSTEKQEVAHKLAEVETWIHGIMASRSYRIMEPLRKLRSVTRRKG